MTKPSAKFVAKMEDVLSVYQRPYDPERPVVCLDEKSKELHTTPHGTLPLEPGKPRREDYEYARNGTRNLFLWVEPLSGRRQVCVTERRTALDFARQLKSLVAAYPDAAQVVLVTDNLNTHTPACLYEAFAPEEARRIAQKIEWQKIEWQKIEWQKIEWQKIEWQKIEWQKIEWQKIEWQKIEWQKIEWQKIEWHYTPEHGSWLNMAETELSVLSRQCLNRRIGDAETLTQGVSAWQARRDQVQMPIRWQFTTEDARIKLRQLYPILANTA